jgi:hypothetical protein
MLVSRFSSLTGRSRQPQLVLVIRSERQACGLGVGGWFSCRRRKLRFLRRFCNKSEWFVLFIVVLIKVPKLFLGFPPLDDPTETGDGQQYLNVPISTVPIWMFVPSLANILHSLYQGFAYLGLGSELGESHLGHVGRNGNDIVEGSHNRIDWIIHEYSRGATIHRRGRGQAAIRVGEIRLCIWR